jgi:hypothetical protein
MKTDSWIGSMVWGRIGGAALVMLAFVLQSFGVDFGVEDQAKTFEAINGVLASVGTVLVVVSKWREQRKKTKAQSGSAVLMVVAVLCLSAIAALTLASCAGQSQNERELYLEARVWYNEAQLQFINVKPTLGQDKIDQVNEMLDTVGLSLDLWGGIGGPTASYKEARDALIDYLAKEVSQ